MRKYIGMVIVVVGLASVLGAQPSNETGQSRNATTQHVVAGPPAGESKAVAQPNESTTTGVTTGLSAGIDEVDVDAVLQQILTGRGEGYDPTKPVGVRRLERALQEIAALLLEIRAGGMDPARATPAERSASMSVPGPATLGGSVSGIGAPGGPTNVSEAMRAASVSLTETVADHARRIEQLERDLDALTARAVSAGAIPVPMSRPE